MTRHTIKASAGEALVFEPSKESDAVIFSYGVGRECMCIAKLTPEAAAAVIFALEQTLETIEARRAAVAAS